MVISSTHKCDAVLIDLSLSKIDASNTEDLLKNLSFTLEKGNHVIMDLSQLEMLDSSGLGLLLNCYREVQSHNKEMIVVAESPLVLSLFKMVHFTKIIEVCKTMDEAIKALNTKHRGF
ncbi:MAG: anti-sigma factor antagonist [Lentisphaeraceae bacterium]|nr:anti-sigma factor antagonist [Lentisphaeraceae bacterium]